MPQPDAMKSFVLIVLVLGAVAWTQAQQPTTQPVDDRVSKIRQLVRQLDADDYTTREQATEALRKIGPDCVSFLQEALLDNPSPEMRTRAEQILKYIEVTYNISTDGGPTVANFQLLLAAQHNSYRAAEPIHLTLTARHVSPHTGQFRSVRLIEVQLDRTDPTIVDGAEARLIISTQAEEQPVAPEARRKQMIRLSDDPPSSIDFIRFGSAAMSIPLNQALVLPAGKYTAQIVYFANSRGLLKDALTDLRSNMVQFEVEPAPSSKPAAPLALP